MRSSLFGFQIFGIRLAWSYPNGFRGRQGIRFRKIASSAAQIIENLVGREIEVMLFAYRFRLQKRTWCVDKQLIRQ
jgi:hypothetical protein